MRRISDYLATLTAAELEQFRDAIADRVEREPTVREHEQQEGAVVVDLAERQRPLMAKLWELDQTGLRLMNSMGPGYLQTVPVATKRH